MPSRQDLGWHPLALPNSVLGSSAIRKATEGGCEIAFRSENELSGGPGLALPALQDQIKTLEQTQTQAMCSSGFTKPVGAITLILQTQELDGEGEVLTQSRSQDQVC